MTTRKYAGRGEFTDRHPWRGIWNVYGRAATTSLLALACLSGCTSLVLRGSTESVTSGIGDILEQQIADNLALFRTQQIPLASQVLLGQGAITIQDNVSPTLKLPYTHTASSSKEGDLGASRQWQEAWTITPVMDPKDLTRLQYAYECASNGCPKGFSYPTVSGAPTAAEVAAFSPSRSWLSFNGCSDHPGWQSLGRHHGQSVCVEPKKFAEFALVILGTAVDTQGSNKQKGAFLAF